MRYKEISSLFLILSLFSCGGNQSIDENIENNNKINNLNENETSESVIDPNIKFYMTFDVLGGVFRKNNEPSKAIGLSTKSLQTTHPSQDEAPEPEQNTKPHTPDVYLSEPFQIDTSKRYNGLNGTGLLTLSIFGEGEETYPSNDPENRVRHFSSLTLRFVFHDFVFDNPCLGKIKLKGEVRCEIQGDYEVAAETFLGEAHCKNGPLENPNVVLYRIPQKDYAIEVDANLKIDGDPYRYRSYSYDGEITIDGEKLLIKDSITKGSSC